MVDEFCIGCKYLGVLSRTPYCAFNDVTGFSRGCKSGTGCDKRTEGNREHSPNYYAFCREEKSEPAADKKKEQYSWSSKSILEGGHDSRKKRAAAKLRAVSQGRQREAILTYKEENNLTVRQMAKNIGISPTTLNKWITEYTSANWEKLEKIGIKKPF